MSQKRERNRNIRNISNFPRNLEENEEILTLQNYLGPAQNCECNEIRCSSKNSNYAELSGTFSEISDNVIENITSDDHSSDSSNSWGAECELEGTHLVQVEYERMIRVLSGLEPVPDHYDKDEYQLWMRTFPSLR